MLVYRTFFSSTKILQITICMLLIFSGFLQASLFDSMKSWFGIYSFEEVIYKEYTIQPGAPCALTFSQEMVGSAVITGWDKNVVAITATKKAGLEDNLRICEFITEHNAGATSVSTGYVKGETVPYITSACIFDIEIFVPYTTTVTVDSISNITIQNINAEVHVETTSGTVKAHNIDGTFIASVEQKGPIILEDMHGTVDVSTASGDIFVENSYKGIRARTYYGTIKVVCAQVPHNSTIDLETQSHGIIELALPEGTQATIAGTTEHGRILSTIPITLARRTTVLTKRAYKKIPKRMKGIIGESGQAKIKLVSTQGIRITSRAH